MLSGWSPMGHDAFISYSHDEDEAFAPILQRTIEQLARPWYRRRALDVFRDSTGLSANPGLWSSITAVLDDSEWFILLASPGAARSEWVDREVAYWLEHKDRSRLLAVVTNGTWAWDSRAMDFNWTASDAVPRALRGAFVEEPRHVDLRWARNDVKLTSRTPRFRDQVAEIAAPLHGVSKDALEGTDLREHRRTMRLAGATIVVLVVLALAAVVGGAAAARNASAARSSQASAESARDESDLRRVVAQSHELSGRDPSLALLLAVEARHARDDVASRGALQAALLANQRFLGSYGEAVGDVQFTDVCQLGTGSTAIATSSDGTYSVLDLERMSLVSTQRLLPPSDVALPAGDVMSAIHCAADADGDVVVLHSSSGTVWRLDPELLPSSDGSDLGEPLNDVAVSADGEWIAAGSTDGRVLVWPASADSSAGRELDRGADSMGVAFSPDDTTLAVGGPDGIGLWDTTTWVRRGTVDDEARNQAGGLVPLSELARWVGYSPDGRYLTSSRRAVTRVFDAERGEVLWERANNFVEALPFAWAPDSGSIFVTDSDTIARLRADDGAELDEPLPDRPLTNGGVVLRDGSTFLTWAAEGRVLSRWALDGSTLISRLLPRPGRQPVSYSPDGRTLLVGAVGYSVVSTTEAIDVATLQHRMDVPSAAYPQLVDGDTVAGYFVEDASVSRLDVRTGARVGPSFPVDITGAVQASNNLTGWIGVAHDDNRVRLYDPDGRELGDPWLDADSYVINLAISPRSDLVSVQTDRGTTMYRLADAAALYDLPANGGILAFAPDGLSLAYGDDGRVVFADSADGHPTGVVATTRSPSGEPQLSSSTLFAVVTSASVELFDSSTGAALGEPFDNAGGAILRPDGLELATTTPYGIQLWDLDPQHWEDAACRAAGRNLTAAEWSTYFPNGGERRATCPSYPLGP